MTSTSASWDAYLWEPGGSVLRNLFGERDAAALAQREYAETAKQQVKIELGVVGIPRTFDAEHLSAIHRRLFGDVYAWAGQYRTVGIRKDATEFAAPPLIPRYLDDASRMIRATSWPTLDHEEFATASATVYAFVNHAHPFREGNGRTAKLFLQQIADSSRFRLAYDPSVSRVTPELWNQASMLSGPDRGAYAPQPASLIPVFRALAVPRADAVAGPARPAPQARYRAPAPRRDSGRGR
ncbi:Fic/DOC family protein [Clavibacter tessellarius]|uniref:Fic/DOC family protein n=1 Tax=Clavibacter tessellarius TaxID=31965 RepID=UPI0039EA0060